MSFKKIGLFSNGKGNDYLPILKKHFPNLKQVQTVEEKDIIETCQREEFDCVILTDDLVDRYHSRMAVEVLVKKIKELCKVIVLSFWDDTLESENDLILVGGREPIPDKCQKILEHI